MILYRVGPGKWLTLQLFLFGLVSTFQAWQTNYSGYLATRFLLGVTESGYIPGGLWTLSTWYTKEETAKRIMIFFFGNQIGQASSKLIAYGILHMRGVAGYPGWFWLFVIMGGFTILSGIILGFFLPDSFHNPTSTFLPKYRFFSERELHILRTRVLRDDPMKGEKRTKIGMSSFKSTVSRVLTNCRTLPCYELRRLIWVNSSPIGASGSIFLSRLPTTAPSVASTPTRPPSSRVSATPPSRATPWPPSVSSFKSPYLSPSATFLTNSKCSPLMYISTQS